MIYLLLLLTEAILLAFAFLFAIAVCAVILLAQALRWAFREATGRAT